MSKTRKNQPPSRKRKRNTFRSKDPTRRGRAPISAWAVSRILVKSFVIASKKIEADTKGGSVVEQKSVTKDFTHFVLDKLFQGAGNGFDASIESATMIMCDQNIELVHHVFLRKRNDDIVDRVRSTTFQLGTYKQNEDRESKDQWTTRPQSFAQSRQTEIY